MRTRGEEGGNRQADCK